MRIIAAVLVGGLLWGAERMDWQVQRERIRQTFHVPASLPDTAEKFYGRFAPTPDVAADRVSFATDYELRVPAIVYHPAGATILKHPALIIVNGHGGDKSAWYATWAGVLYARAGAVVLTYDPIGEFERNKDKRSATGQHDQLLPPDDMARRMAGLMITDIMQGARYLAKRPDVDPARIAVLGFSMGSFISSLACAVDTSVRACVLVGGGNLDGPGGYWDLSGKKMCQAIPYQSLSFLGDRGPAIYALHAKRGSTFIYNGTADKVVAAAKQDFFQNLRQQTAALVGSQKDLFEFAFFEGGGHQPYFLTKPVALWLNEKLKFPNWTKKQIQAMEESNTHGLQVLGPAVEEIPPDTLRALPDAVWDSQRASYVYESWVERAGAAVNK